MMEETRNLKKSTSRNLFLPSLILVEGLARGSSNVWFHAFYSLQSVHIPYLRPLILPEHVTLRIQVPFNSRGHAWVLFDGKDEKQLAPGDALVCSMSVWPVPTACRGDSTNDFLHSIHEGLHWNLRKTQSFDGPRES
ncbi:hypothetical protein E3N88_13704 [Mikania micrantha]|uniref:Uncharacterized protein n=1 Tax=Mikania micrantha TaxID=192012 RepID=A0A5N6NZC1_9ASTR|nr:hypothetical protein E3N88_13704 [Mikania micrantha]